VARNGRWPARLDARKRLPRQLEGEPAALALDGLVDDADGLSSR